jgi:hypothetical protein
VWPEGWERMRGTGADPQGRRQASEPEALAARNERIMRRRPLSAGDRVRITTGGEVRWNP